MLFYVYRYRDPRPGKGLVPIYIGKGKLGSKRQTLHGLFPRAYEHLRKSAIRSASTVFSRFLKSILGKGFVPIIEIVRICQDEAAAFRFEAFLIAKYGRRDLGKGPLLNNTDGGDGAIGYWTEVNRKRQSEHGKRLAKKRWEKESEKINLAEQARFRWTQPGYREDIQPKFSISAKRRANDPRWRKAHSKRIKRLWKEERERMLPRKKQEWGLERRIAHKIRCKEQQRDARGRFSS